MLRPLWNFREALFSTSQRFVICSTRRSCEKNRSWLSERASLHRMRKPKEVAERSFERIQTYTYVVTSTGRLPFPVLLFSRRSLLRKVYCLHGGISVELLARLPKSKHIAMCLCASMPLCLKGKSFTLSKIRWMSRLRLHRIIKICTPSFPIALSVSLPTLDIIVVISE